MGADAIGSVEKCDLLLGMTVKADQRHARPQSGLGCEAFERLDAVALAAGVGGLDHDDSVNIERLHHTGDPVELPPG